MKEYVRDPLAHSNIDGEHVAIVLLWRPLLHLHCLENGLMSDVQTLHIQFVNCRKLLNKIVTKLNKFYFIDVKFNLYLPFQNEHFNKS